MLTTLSLLVALGPLTASFEPSVPQGDNDAVVTRLSLPIEDDHALWQSPGFRLRLGIVHDRIFGQLPTPSGSGTAVLLRPEIQLDARASLGFGLRYGSFSSTYGDGFRWAATIEPTMRLVHGLRVAVGLGVGGLAVSKSQREGPTGEQSDYSSELVPRHTDVTAKKPIDSCDDLGAMALAKIEYLFVIGALFATGPEIQVAHQWLTCTRQSDIAQVETGLPALTRQAWRASTLTFGWGFSWR